MASTTTGTDHQANYYSISKDGCGIGIGGPNPVSLPADAVPADLVFDPSDASSAAAAQAGANPKDPSSYDAILKVADGRAGLSLAGVRVAQGHEDSVNMTNGVDQIHLSGTISDSPVPGLRCITDKGNPGVITYGATVIVTPGVEEDIKLGDWLDQSLAATGPRDLTLVVRKDGAAVRVVVGHAGWPTTGAHQRVLLWASLKLKAYWWVKRVVRAVCRIPVGTPGPKWLS